MRISAPSASALVVIVVYDVALGNHGHDRVRLLTVHYGQFVHSDGRHFVEGLLQRIVPEDGHPDPGMLFQIRRDFLESGLVAILDQGLVEIEMDVRKRSTFLADSFLLLLPLRLSAIWWLIVPPLSIMLVIPTIGTI